MLATESVETCDDGCGFCNGGAGRDGAGEDGDGSSGVVIRVDMPVGDGGSGEIG